ncbi:hypothetical protein [Mycobacterium sp. E2462]|uniref:hypothetical protein n=1 Tax=Mycobacterium sp. E2462 TaxID=1834133 RepID=UPI0012EA19EB|nr:hypothetical protein [Mycobacterium sp. E2462]
MVKRRRRIAVASHGTSGYRQGCRCDTCKEAESARNARYRASGTTKNNVTQLRTAGPGEVERAVINECEIHGTVTNFRAPMARSLARVLDNPSMAGRHVQTAKQLVQALEALHGNGSGKRKGSSARLALVKEQTKSRRPPK